MADLFRPAAIIAALILTLGVLDGGTGTTRNFIHDSLPSIAAVLR